MSEAEAPRARQARERGGSVKIAAAFLGLVLQIAPAAAAKPPPCSDAFEIVPPGYRFGAPGETSGGLALTLSLPRSARAGDSIIAAMKMQSADGQPRALLTDERPWGLEYQFEVRDAATGATVPVQYGLQTITTISRENVDARCAAYEVANLSHRVRLAPGRYLVRARRTPTEEISETPSTLRKLPEVVSNDVTITITR
jgi:hypothetical protein